jgi:PAS domain S-box-containing protein
MMMTSLLLPDSDQLKIDAVRLQRALNAAQLGSWQYDPVRGVFSWDACSREIFSTPGDETTVEAFMTWVHADDVERVWAAYHAALDPAEPKRSATEFRLKRGDGEVRWVKTVGLAYFDFEGDRREPLTVSVVGTVADITEQKECEEREHLLIREVCHRAKNMLSVVNAIAHQTAANSPEDFLDRFSERIEALSTNQDLLIQNDWRGVGVENLVHAQLAHFASLIGSHIIVRGPKLVLKPAATQAIGLALRELASNAGKYGTLSGETGRVDVCWGNEGDTFTICWTENGGAPVFAPARRGFGTMVMKEMAERSLDGKVDLDYAPSGMTWRLTCPAANALERRPRAETA